MQGPDEATIRELFIAHGPALLLYARQWLDRPAAQDVVQAPPDLNALFKDQDMSPQVLIDALNPNQKVGFIYVRPAGDWQKHPRDLLVLYESTPNGKNIGYADGHVERWPTHEQILQQVKAAEERNRAVGEHK